MCLAFPIQLIGRSYFGDVCRFLGTSSWLTGFCYQGLVNGAKLAFDPMVRMDYRQHGANMAPIRFPFDANQVIRDTKKVREHYRLLQASPIENVLPDCWAQVEEVAIDVERFSEQVVSQPKMLGNYIRNLNTLDPQTVWWWDVAQPALQWMWKDCAGSRYESSRINGVAVGPGHPPYIVAEIGSNHNGDMNLCRRLIDSAAESGAQAVKFQSWTNKSLISEEEYARNISYADKKKHFGSLREMVTAYQFTPEQHVEAAAHCKSRGIAFCSTPFAVEEAELLESLNVPFFKIASMDIIHLSLLKYVARKQRPVIISTGMARWPKLSELSKRCVLKAMSRLSCCIVCRSTLRNMIPFICATWPLCSKPSVCR